MLETGISKEQWDHLVSEAQQFAANVCQSINNSVDESFAEQKKLELETSLKEMENANE
jgi:fructokinase